MTTATLDRQQSKTANETKSAPLRAAVNTAALSTAATKPRAKATKPSSQGPTLNERIAGIRESIALASEKIEMAYDAVELGEPLDVLLDHIAHELLGNAVRPIHREYLTKADAEHVYESLFTPLACLQAAVSLSAGTVVHHTLAGAHALLDQVQTDLDSCADIAKALPTASPESDFIRGRDIAIRMMNEGAELAGERECYRRYRIGGAAQDNFVNGYLSDIIEEPALREGFTAVLSQIVGGGEVFDSAYFEQLTIAETQSGEIGADGTGADEEAPVAAREVPRKALNDGPSHAPYIAACQAMCVLEVATLEAGSDVLFGLRSLLEKIIGTIGSATGQRQAGAHGEEDHELASNEMAGFLAVLRAVDSLSDGNQSELLGAVETLVIVAKNQIDDMMLQESRK
ncbi:hypothetical protein J2W32_001484 [Variovorax boronicumulans]|uniref:DUF1631 domain-containing protein n=1 Tax=Variovorax boronicumulans TaxID=436515 RepID=A0AAW8CVD7_9BURK|nr:hypothetical protein [Variovorax boronicumulans]MDP9893211.1 hypothetical protein [Variovorax boronicumulans]MDQ0052442.1 hypothetical protein [Variovorax boronicumulans]